MMAVFSMVRPWVAGGLILTCCHFSLADTLEEDATWNVAGNSATTEFLQKGLKTQGTGEDQIQQAIDSLQKRLDQSPPDRMEAFIEVAASVVPTLGEKIEALEQSPQASNEDPFLGIAAPLRDQARLWVARNFVRQRLFDEALPLLEPLEPQDSIEPAMMLFYRGVCNHTLLQKEAAIEDLTKLLENEDVIPRRYARTAKMMLKDIQPMKEDTLDEIARLMNDVSRRLDLGRSGERVVNQEQEIIDKLDKMIEKMEQQQKQQQQQQSQSQSGNGSQSQPMQDSQIAGGSGPGDVDSRDLGDLEAWGNLPAAQRKEALQKISQDLPTHYREAIEAYFRKLATEKP